MSGTLDKAPLPGRILVAEDNPINAALVLDVLRKAGYECILAGDGLAAIEAVRQSAFDLVLMDSLLPEIDGLEATRRIRRLEEAGQLARKGGRRLPIVALTASAPQEGGDWMSAGLDEYLVKPTGSQRLLEVIARHLGIVPNLTAALARLQGREPLLKKLAEEFLAGLDDLLQRMRKAASERDGPALAFVAHKLKGQAGVFDAHAAADAAGRLEAAAWKSDWEAAASRMADLERLLPTLCEALRA